MLKFSDNLHLFRPESNQQPVLDFPRPTPHISQTAVRSGYEECEGVVVGGNEISFSSHLGTLCWR